MAFRNPLISPEGPWGPGQIPASKIPKITAEMLDVRYQDDISGRVTTIQPDGVRLYSAANNPFPSVELTTGTSHPLSTKDPLTGEVMAGLDDSGTSIGREGSFDTLEVGGRNFNEIIRPFGYPIKYGERQFAFTVTAGERALFELTFTEYPNTMYEIALGSFAMVARIKNLDYFRCRTTTGSTRPTLSSKTLFYVPIRAHDQNGDDVIPFTAYYIHRVGAISGPRTRRLLFTYQAGTEAGVPGFTDMILQALVKYAGPILPNNAIVRDDSSENNTAPPTTVTQPDTIDIDEVLNPIGWKSWLGENWWPSSGPGASNLMQGYVPGDGRASMSQVYYNRTTIGNIMNGLQDYKVELKLTCVHAGKSTGVVTRFHAHPFAPGRSTFGSMSQYFSDATFSPGQTRTIGLTSEGWQTSYAGIGLTPRGDPSIDYYGYFKPNPTLRITGWKVA